MERVNRITVALDGDEAMLTLYRTHRRLCILRSGDLDIPNMSATNAKTQTIYLAYCKQVLINLLQNGGVEGYYYEEKQEVDGDTPRKFTSDTFDQRAEEYVAEILGSMDLPYDINVTSSPEYPEVTERYKDGGVKYGVSTVQVRIAPKGHSGVDVRIPVQVKSGQMCKPRTMILGNTEYSINRTNIDKLIVTEGSHGKTKTI